LGVDVGSVRVGVARSDQDGLMAVAVATLPRSGALSELEGLWREYSPIEIVLGLPVSLAGAHTASTNDAQSFAQELALIVDCPIRMVDERLSTVQAAAGLRKAGRSERAARGVIDQAAAVILLQHALDAERLQGVPPGFLIESPRN